MKICALLIFSTSGKVVEEKDRTMARKRSNRKKFKILAGEKLLSLTAVLISVGTLLVFLYQTNLVRKQQYMSVLPYLEFQNHAVFSPDYKLVLKNKGIGPAMIISRYIKVKDRKLDLDMGMYLREHLGMEDSVEYLTSSLIKGNLISEKEGVELVRLQPSSSTSGMEKLHGLIHNDSLEFVVEYVSVYGERWQVSSKKTVPIKLD